MKSAIRVLVVVMIVATGLVAANALLAQGEHRITPPDSPIALWCTGEGNKTIMAYRFDRDGTSHFAWRYTPGMTPVAAPMAEATASASDEFADRLSSAAPEATEVASSPTDGSLINEAGIALRMEADGRLSVSTVQWDGKVFVLYFSGCPDPKALDAFVIENGTWSNFRMN